MVRIKTAVKADANDFIKIYHLIFAESFSYYPKRAKTYLRKVWTREGFLDVLNDKNYLLLLAKGGKDIVGYLIGKYFADKSSATIKWVGVVKSRQREGIGRRLIRKWEAWARLKKAKCLRISTTDPKKIAYYQKLGYELEKEKKKNDWGMDRYFLFK